MNQDDAKRVWDLPKCERCDAMEVRLRAALDANESWSKGYERLKEQAEKLLTENTKLRKYVDGAWGKA